VESICSGSNISLWEKNAVSNLGGLISLRVPEVRGSDEDLVSLLFPCLRQTTVRA
jgi:hypothetical protein